MLRFTNDLGHAIINDVAEIIKKGETIIAGKEYDNIFRDSRAIFLNVDERNLAGYFRTCFAHYNSKHFSGLQLLWTDRNDKFPWEEGFEEVFIYKQPLLDRNANFKFLEPENLAIFTTKQWIESKTPILRVVHDHDGDWQFLTEDVEIGGGSVVALGRMVEMDITLNEVFDLEYGEEAEREFLGGEWIRYKLDEEPEEEDMID